MRGFLRSIKYRNQRSNKNLASYTSKMITITTTVHSNKLIFYLITHGVFQRELTKYKTLKSNMDLYFTDQLQVDMTNDDHRELMGFLKKHVSSFKNSFDCKTMF